MYDFIGFTEGRMTMFGYSFEFGGELPHITVENETALSLWYCCREDGETGKSLNLPEDFPFILFIVRASL